ncbi:MAG: hypothetical protein ACLQU2_33930 [Candidatus Binataceae bacterium]
MAPTVSSGESAVPQVKQFEGKRQWVIDRNTVMGYANTSSVVRTDGVKSTAVSAASFDPELRLVCAQIFNDEIAEIRDESSNRIFPIGLMPWDVELAVKETRRCHGMGMKGINTTPVRGTTRSPGLDSAPSASCSAPTPHGSIRSRFRQRPR